MPQCYGVIRVRDGRFQHASTIAEIELVIKSDNFYTAMKKKCVFIKLNCSKEKANSLYKEKQTTFYKFNVSEHLNSALTDINNVEKEVLPFKSMSFNEGQLTSTVKIK